MLLLPPASAPPPPFPLKFIVNDCIAPQAEMVDAFTAELGGLPPFPQPGLYDYMTSGTPPALVESRRQAAADFLRTAGEPPALNPAVSTARIHVGHKADLLLTRQLRSQHTCL